jgi:hypothetical protein
VTEPRGIRNNNALNIEYSVRTQWQGLDAPPSDGRFARFVEPQWGLRAGIIILRNYQKRGLVTLLQMISTWAPPHENNPDSYAGSVARVMGINPHDVVDLNNKALVIKMLKGMVRVECGPPPTGTANGDWLDDSVYEAAWSLTRPMTASRTARGSVAAGGAAVAGAILEAATEVLPQAADAATMVTPIWPEVARWVLIAVVIAGAGLALYSRLQARKEGIR